MTEIFELKKKFSGLFSNKKFVNSHLKEYFLSEISKNSKKAELLSLKQGLAQLELAKNSKESQSMLSFHHKNMNSTETISSKVSIQHSDNFQLRREILKKKLQIDEFIKKYVLNLRESISAVLKPMHTLVGREIQEYSKIANFLYANNLPSSINDLSCEEMIPLFTNYSLTPRLFAVSKLLEAPAFSNTTKLLEASKIVYEKAFENSFSLIDLPQEKINATGIKNYVNNDCKDVKEMIVKTSQEIENLNEEFDIWEIQPAQHAIPWRKDFFDLNVSEALELWKTSVFRK